MNEIRESLKKFITDTDLRDVSIRQVGRMLRAPGEKDVHPQTVKYYWLSLFMEGEVDYLYDGSERSNLLSTVKDGILGNSAKLVTIPIFGAASCGPATQMAVEEREGELHVSSSLLGSAKKYDMLYALRAKGNSMNKASIKGVSVPINDDDYVIIDRNRNTPSDGECVVMIVDGVANIKKFYREQDRITLVSESSEPYDPIFITPEDQSDSLIGGTVIQVVPKSKHL